MSTLKQELEKERFSNIKRISRIIDAGPGVVIAFDNYRHVLSIEDIRRAVRTRKNLLRPWIDEQVKVIDNRMYA